MKRMRLTAVLALATALAACGKVAPLEPPHGQPLPVKPLLAKATPTPEELLTPPSYAKPQRIDELMKRSAPRRADPFDLPPPDGGAAPVPETQPESSSEKAGPATPQ